MSRKKYHGLDQGTYDLLMEAWEYCDDEDKSTEFMIAYMMDTAEVDHDTVMDFLERVTEKEIEDWRGYVPTEDGKGFVKS